MLTLRLEKDLEAAVEQAAAVAGVSKSELVRQCLGKCLLAHQAPNVAWELGQDLFGQYRSGRGDLSSRGKVLVREKIHARRGRR